jgi:hypothetical protein
MPKYYVVFTEESTKDYGYYVDADDKENAYVIAEAKYFENLDADIVSTSYAKTHGYEVQDA